MYVRRPIGNAMVCLALITSSAVLPPNPVEAQTRPCATPERTTDAEFHEGQVWSFRSRPGEEASTLTVLRVESVGKIGVVIHVRIDDIRFGNCTGGPAPTSIAHVPFAKAALAQSVTKLLRNLSTVPEYMDGYKDWVSHCGGAYTISVAEDDRTFNAGLGCRTPS